jgi:tRNA G10  N-methylase Trm11
MQFQMKVSNLLGDASSLKLDSNSIDLIITHPPYFGIDVERYGGDAESQINFSKNEKKVLKLFKKVFLEAERVLRPGGNLVLANNELYRLTHRVHILVVVVGASHHSHRSA